MQCCQHFKCVVLICIRMKLIRLWFLIILIQYNNCNCKLAKLQYKLLMKISACKYMRFNMLIVKCCDNSVETLPQSTSLFIDNLDYFNRNKIDKDYHDTKKFHFIACNHSLPIISHCNNQVVHK